MEIKMLQIMRKLLIVVLVGLLVSGCEGMTTREGVGTGFGTVLGALGGNYLAKKAGIDPTVGTVLGAALGAAAGMKIGSALDKYFGENDKKNLETLLDDDKPQRVAWCSDKEGKPSRYVTPTRNIKAVQCGSGNKIIQSVGVGKKVKTADGIQVCKPSKAEIDDSGTPKTIPVQFCKKPGGTWSQI